MLLSNTYVCFTMCGFRQEFTRQFVQRLDDTEYRGAINIKWNIGGLHFSQTQRVFSQIGSKANFINVSLSTKMCCVDEDVMRFCQLNTPDST